MPPHCPRTDCAFRRCSHGWPDPRAIEKDTATALRLAAPVPQPLCVRSDEHPAYPRALRALAGYTLTHERTSSLQARTAPIRNQRRHTLKLAY